MPKREAIIILFLVLNFYSWSFLFSFHNAKMEVVFFDVGQGNAILIKTPQKHHILIDGGPDNVVLERLGQEMSFFDNYLDLVILTHPHHDHVSGLIEVVERYGVGDILCTGVREETAVARRWAEILEEKGYRQARAGMRVSANDFHINILYPAEDLRGKHMSDANEASVVSRLVFKDNSFLFTGDIYAKQEREIISFEEECREKEEDWCSVFTLNSDVLEVGHHGSRTSTSEEFLSYVSPSIGVIMVGRDNSYGHPHHEVTERLEKFNVRIKRTDKHGNIRVVSQ